MPQDAWEQVNGLYIYARDHVPTRRGRFEFMRRVIHGAQQINGMLSGAMSRTAAYDFVRLGRYLERADMTTRILDVRSANLLPRANNRWWWNRDRTGLGWNQPVSGRHIRTAGTRSFREHSMDERIEITERLPDVPPAGTVAGWGPDVLKFLLQDESLPRAVACCLTQMELCLRNSPRTPRRSPASPPSDNA